MAGQSDDEEQRGEQYARRKHDLALQHAAGSRGDQDERDKKQAGNDVARDLRREHRDDQKQVRALQRDEDADNTSHNREHRVRPMLRLQVVILAAPGEARQRHPRQENDLKGRETKKRDAADDRDDLRHAITVSARG
jgi:hypothetical protein